MTNQVTPYTNWLCSCGHQMLDLARKEGEPRLMVCTNRTCKYFKVHYQVPIFDAEEAVS